MQVATAACTYKAEPASVKITWTAFKTMKKLAVEGGFKDVKLTGAEKTYASVAALLGGVTAQIDGMSVESSHPARDQNLSYYTFKEMKKKAAIQASFRKNEIVIRMNGHKGTIPFQYKLSESGELEITGSMDVLTFKGQKSLKALGTACHDLHKGDDGVSKTWPDVDLKVVAKVSKTCI